MAQVKVEWIKPWSSAMPLPSPSSCISCAAFQHSLPGCDSRVANIHSQPSLVCQPVSHLQLRPGESLYLKEDMHQHLLPHLHSTNHTKGGNRKGLPGATCCWTNCLIFFYPLRSCFLNATNVVGIIIADIFLLLQIRHCLGHVTCILAFN